MNAETCTLLVSQAIQLALLSLVVWICTQTFARNRPHLAHALWGLVLLKCLMPPIWSSPAGVFSRLQLPTWIQDNPRESLTPSAFATSNAEAPIIEPPTIPRLSATIHVEPLKAATETGREIKQIALKEAEWSDWLRWIMPVWIAGGAVWLIVFFARLGAFCYRLWRMRQIDMPAVTKLTQETASQLGLRRNVHVRVVDGNIGPAVVGFLRPVILLPACIATQVSRDQLRPLIAHELIHVRRGDLVWALLQTLSTCVWWFHPLVWTAARRLTQEAEKSCDQETILGLGCAPATYARGLLSVLEYKNQLKVAPALPGVRPIEVTKSRMERIMKIRQGCDRRTPNWIWGVMLCAGLAILPGANWVAAQDQKPATPVVPNATSANETQAETENANNAGQTGTAGVTNRTKSKTSVDTETDAAPILASPPRGDEKQVTKPWTIRTYQIASILKRLTDSGLNRAAAKQRLMEMLPASAPDQLGRDASILDDAGNAIELGNQNPRMVLRDDQLIVFDGATVHEEIAKLLRQYDRFGFDVLHIESTIALVPADQWKDVDIEWPELNAGSTQNVSKKKDAKNIEPQPRPATALPPRAWPAPIAIQPGGKTPAPQGTGQGDVPQASNAAGKLPRLTLPHVVPVLQASARTVTHESYHVNIAVLEATDLAETLREQPGIEILSRPQVLTQNGRTATVEVGRRIPIITGYRAREDGSDTDQLEPMIEEVQEGTTMRLTPELQDNRFVHLQLRVEIMSVKEDASQTPDDTKNARQRIPMISSTYVESSVNVPLDATLAIGGLAIEQEGKKYRLLCLIRCRKAYPDTDRSAPKGKTELETQQPESQSEKTKERQPPSDNDSAAASRDERTPSVRMLPSVSIQPVAIIPKALHAASSQQQAAEDREMSRASKLIRSEDFESADQVLTKFRKQFPESKNELLAYRLAILCKLKLCELPKGHANSTEAAALLSEVHEQYPDESANPEWQAIAARVDEQVAKHSQPKANTAKLEWRPGSGVANHSTTDSITPGSQSKASHSNGLPARVRLDLLGKRDLFLQSRGQVTTLGGSDPTVCAEDVVLRWSDGTTITAELMELQWSGEKTEARLQGQIRISINSMELTAKQGRLRSDRVELSGDVSFAAKGTRGTCDALVLEENGLVSLIGNVQLRKDSSNTATETRSESEVELQAKSIQMQIHDGPVIVKSVQLKRLNLKAAQAGRDE